jgi:UDP-N-acetylmuramate dehydrogenase
MTNLKECIEYIHKHTPFIGEMRYDEPLARHTTFRVGGPADLWVRPAPEVFAGYAACLFSEAALRGVPVFILGAGANLVVSDKGIRGIVLDTGAWSGCRFPPESAAEDGDAVILSGTPLDEVAEKAASLGWGGLTFLAGMPGTMGGAVWMNARCYGKSVSDVLAETESLERNGNRVRAPARAEEYGYKKSPFQRGDALILSVTCGLTRRERPALYAETESYRRDRTAKGHYRFPSAGSAFKNNPDFGEPVGAIVDRLGLRGLRVGGAQVAPWHGNLIINTGGATASDIRDLTTRVAALVKRRAALTLEPEILFAGDWQR